MNTRVTAGMDRPMASSSAAREKTSSVGAYMATSPRFITSTRLATRAISSMLWETSSTVVPRCS